MRLIIDNLKEGYYAMAIYHDENSNNEFDTFLSFPEEKYGFSNDAAVFLINDNWDSDYTEDELNKYEKCQFTLKI